MRYFGSQRRELRGATCPNGSAIGTPFFSAITAGANEAYGSVFWKPWVEIRTWSTCSSIPLSSGHISMPRAQKGARQPGAGSLAWRVEHENPCCCERRQPAHPVFVDWWAAPRHDRSRDIAEGPFAPIRHCGQSLRQRSSPSANTRTRGQAGDPIAPRMPQTSPRSRSLQTTQCPGAFLQQGEALPAGCYSIRQNRLKLLRLSLPGFADNKP